MTRVMVTGAHGIGKSQTCIKLNKALPDFLYIPSFGGTVAKRMGFDLNQPHSTQQIIDYQERLLEVFIESYKATANCNSIYDRSPNDIAAYLSHGLDYDKHEKYIHDYARRCLDATRKYCDVLLYPEADLEAPMESKHNRPQDNIRYNRMEFDRLLDFYASRVTSTVHVIDIPKEYQYDKRVNYILEKLKNAGYIGKHTRRVDY